MLSSEEVEHGVSLLSAYLHTQWPQDKGRGYFPVLLDNSLDSHLVLLAMSRLRMNCALIDPHVSSHQLKEYLTQIDETDVYQSSVLLAGAGLEGAREGTISGTRTPSGDGVDSLPRADGSVVIFTSGSAGRPNGVVFPWTEAFKIISGGFRPDSIAMEREVVLNLQPLHWSVGLFHVLSAHRGHTVVTLDPLSLSAGQLLREIASVTPTTVYLGADFARVFGRALAQYEGEVLPTVSRFAVGAGALRWEDLLPFKKLISPNAEFVHTYGASEAVGMMSHASRFGDVPAAGPVPLGQPRTEGAVRFVATDEPSLFEVYASARIASGYLDPVLTHRRFVEDEDGTVWWRSGDQVRLCPDTGEYHFHGRLDDLVKISDKRVSLVEMETALRGYPSVADATVRVVPLGQRDRVVAFVQPLPGHTLVESVLTTFLQQALPRGSRPHLVLTLSEIPYTSRHKPDIQKLRAVAAEAIAEAAGM